MKKKPVDSFPSPHKPKFNLIGFPFKIEPLYDAVLHRQYKHEFTLTPRQITAFQNLLAREPAILAKYLMTLLSVGSILETCFDDIEFGDPPRRSLIRKYLHTDQHPALRDVFELKNDNKSESASIAWQTMLSDAMSLLQLHWLETVTTINAMKIGSFSAKTPNRE